MARYTITFEQVSSNDHDTFRVCLDRSGHSMEKVSHLALVNTRA